MARYYATLVRGETYFIGERRVDRGMKTPLIVTEDEKAHLEEHAVDTLSTSDQGEVIIRQKFSFTPVGEEKEDGEDGEEGDEGGEGDDEGANAGGGDTGAAPRTRSRARNRSR